MADLSHLEERVRKADEDSEALRIVRARFDELTAECALIAVQTEQTKAERDTLAAHIHECCGAGRAVIEKSQCSGRE